MLTQIFKEGIEITHELKVLRLLWNVNGGPISLTAIVVIKNIKISTLSGMKNDGLILMNDNFIEITEKGIEKYRESLRGEWQ